MLYAFQLNAINFDIYLPDETLAFFAIALAISSGDIPPWYLWFSLFSLKLLNHIIIITILKFRDDLTLSSLSHHFKT